MADTPAFTWSVRRTLEEEGLWSDIPADRGGKTKYGITERLAAQYGYKVKDLTRDQAIDIYRQEFWDALRLDLLTSRWVAFEVFNTAVNMGRPQAVLCAQRAANLMLPGDPLRVDGAMGPATRAALNALSARYHRQLLHAMNGFQFVAYLDIHRNDPVMADVFIKGWMKRLVVADEAPERAA